VARQEDIFNDFLESDRVWPPSLVPDAFIKALVEVLICLPDDDYDTVSEKVSFVVEDPRISAVNVPFNRTYPSLPNGITLEFHTIVIFHQALTYPHTALVGLLAHELAHSFGSGQDYKADEDAANTLVVRWGFGEEIEALHVEKQKVN